MSPGYSRSSRRADSTWTVEDEPAYINHYAGAMAASGIPYEELSAGEVMDRFPQFTLDESVLGVYQRGAGLVDAGKANAVHVALAGPGRDGSRRDAGVRCAYGR